MAAYLAGPMPNCLRERLGPAFRNSRSEPNSLMRWQAMDSGAAPLAGADDHREQPAIREPPGAGGSSRSRGRSSSGHSPIFMGGARGARSGQGARKAPAPATPAWRLAKAVRIARNALIATGAATRRTTPAVLDVGVIPAAHIVRRSGPVVCTGVEGGPIIAPTSPPPPPPPPPPPGP